NPEETVIVKTLSKFPDVVVYSAQENAPHSVAQYLNDLAQAFNTFYNKHKIVENETRVVLTQCVAHVLKNGLYLLGIKTVEKM
ncbi:MAG: DALR anticodon-binding domain-containing protein, partial [Patescibacteria group bacterium]